MDGFRADDRRLRPIRLLWLIDSLAMGGAERLTVTFARQASAADLDLRVGCLKSIDGNPLESALEDTGVPCDVFHAANLRDRRAFGQLRRVLREERIDIVHAHLTYATLWGVAAARLQRIPCVATVHVPPAAGPAWSRERIRERLMCGLLNRSRTTVIAVSAALRDRYLRRGLIDPSRMVVVPNGIDAENAPTTNPGAAARLRAALSLPPDARVLIAAAVLRERRKGLHVLLEAMPKVLAASPAVRLVVIGEGPLLGELQAQAKRLGVDAAVRWAGARPDVTALLPGAEIFVHPALDDPFPTVVLEAMAAGLPVVATTVDGIPEMIASGRHGLLVPASDASALALALNQLLANADARAALGAEARRVALERFSAAVWVRALRHIYERSLSPGVSAEQSRPAPTVAAP